MNAVGISFLVAGLALLITSLIYALPVRRKLMDHQKTIEESQEEIDQHLRDLRRERDDWS